MLSTIMEAVLGAALLGGFLIAIILLSNDAFLLKALWSFRKRVKERHTQANSLKCHDHKYWNGLLPWVKSHWGQLLVCLAWVFLYFVFADNYRTYTPAGQRFTNSDYWSIAFYCVIACIISLAVFHYREEIWGAIGHAIEHTANSKGSGNYTKGKNVNWWEEKQNQQKSNGSDINNTSNAVSIEHVEKIRDYGGRIIAQIDHFSNGMQVIRTYGGRNLGRYDPRENTTRNYAGIIISRGNTLTSLIEKDK